MSEIQKKKKKRFQLDLTERKFEMLDELKGDFDLTSRVEVIRRALRVFKTLSKYRGESEEIRVKIEVGGNDEWLILI